MIDFASSIGKFTVKVKTRAQLVYDGAVQATLASIKFGSPITGAPGQPIESGDLVRSWTVKPESATSSLISTDSPYAKSNEDGIARPGGGPYRLLAARGGRWSLALTIAGFQRLVADINRKLGATP